MVLEISGGRTRYRLTETLRQYALEKLDEPGEADRVRDHYTGIYPSLELSRAVTTQLTEPSVLGSHPAIGAPP